MSQETLFLIITLTLLGAALGSFLMAAFYRIPRGISLWWPPSRCPACDASIPPWLNIPVFGYLFAKGKCRSCSVPIPCRYPLFELAVAAAYGMLAWQFWSNSDLLIRAAIFLFFLLACAGVDLFVALDDEENEGIIPDIFSLGGLVVGLGLAWWQGRLGIAIPAALVGGGVLLAIYLFYLYVRRIEALGLGDVKMMAMIGAFSDIPTVFLSIFGGSVLGLVAAGLYMLKLRTFSLQLKIPFGPFLAAGAIIGLLQWQ
ncbi:prepilin peptidase [Chrysiogenes arsenatis]|uniref:prepilin peptidase n=1 Tax=Chrysiogenes arsenatis TaxID=309797 RepID=UPI00040F3C82|nr:A24 family peptidase [Chrysiogenes arsenatis]